ncbi:MAG: hypothetical protein M1837_006640 [Sclerophora amabilis]|nr:MAG: hypothetical protein M1837_006640 [Sclerophora amabilis]
MKTSCLSAAALVLLQLAAAQPHRQNVHKHVQRSPAKEVVILKQNGVPISTYTQEAGGSPTPAPAPAPEPEVKNKGAKAPNSYAPPAPSPKEDYSPSDEPASGNGISYTPFNDDRSCKTQDEVNSDFESIDGYSLIRLYGTECDQVTTVGNAAKAKGMKLYVGIANDKVLSPDQTANYGSIQSQCEAISQAVGGSWDLIDTVGVGNEMVQTGVASGEVVKAIHAAKDALKGKGYDGNVVTADTFVAMIDSPDICKASDYAAANCHPYFDGHVQPENAGEWVKQQAKNVGDKCGKKVVITETGWPTQGGANGNAQPSKENQETVVSGIKEAFSDNPSGVIFFSAFNEAWKEDTGATNGVEKYWGVLSN